MPPVQQKLCSSTTQELGFQFQLDQELLPGCGISNTAFRSAPSLCGVSCRCSMTSVSSLVMTLCWRHFKLEHTTGLVFAMRWMLGDSGWRKTNVLAEHRKSRLQQRSRSQRRWTQSAWRQLPVEVLHIIIVISLSVWPKGQLIWNYNLSPLLCCTLPKWSQWPRPTVIQTVRSHRGTDNILPP